MQAKFRFIALLILILTGIQPMFSRSHQQQDNLKGHIFRVVTHIYYADNKFGEDVKEKLKCSDTTFFNSFGNYWKSSSHKSYSYEHYEYEYDEHNRLIQIKENGLLLAEYNYFPNGKLKEENHYYESKLAHKIKWQYAESESRWFRYHGDGDLESSGVISNGGKKEVILDKSVGKMYYSGIDNETGTTRRIYDDSGRISEEITDTDAEGWFSTSHSHQEKYFQYNTKGDLILIKTIKIESIDDNPPQRDPLRYTTRYTYEYDENGNWIICKEYENGYIKTWTEREITYASSDKEIAKMMYSEEKRKERERFVRDSLSRRKLFVIDSIIMSERRERFVRDSIAQRNQFIQDSLTIRRKFVRDSLDNRIKFVQDSLTQIAKAKEIREQQFYAWLENVTRKYVESNRGRSAVLYSLTGESVLLPWKLKTKDGNITSFFKKGHTFDFILNRKESLADITFEDMVRIPLKDSDIDCIMVFFTEDKKYALLFFEEWDHDTSRYHCKLACLATQSGDNTDTKVFAFSSKCQKEIMEYYNNNAPKRNQYLY